MDRELDTGRAGPLFLKRDAIANVVAVSLYRGVELGHYELASFVIMANHVLVLLLPKVDVSRLMKSLKGCTSRHANRLLGRTGTPFWQKESYDHWVRNDVECKRIAGYIENNPVRAGLVPQAGDYRWSSAFELSRVDTSLDAARPGACATRKR
jgi:REP element-mobilizing transposase RayT